MPLLTAILPGSISVSAVSSGLSLATCFMILAAHPASTIALFILAAGSFGINITTLVMLGVQRFTQKKNELNESVAGKIKGVHVASNQLGLAFTQAGIWLALVITFVADLSSALSHPNTLHCPSAHCSRYITAFTFAYINLFVIAGQLLGFWLLIYEVQSAPRRVLADRSLQAVLRKSLTQLVFIREEVRRVRSLGPEYLDRSPRSSEVFEVETTATLRRAESAGSLPTYTLNYSSMLEDRIGQRRRTRTVSASFGEGKSVHEALTLDEVEPIVVESGAESGAGTPRGEMRGGTGLQLHSMRSQKEDYFPHFSPKPQGTPTSDISDPFNRPPRLCLTPPPEDARHFGIPLHRNGSYHNYSRSTDRSNHPSQSNSTLLPYSPPSLNSLASSMQRSRSLEPKDSRISPWMGGDQLATPRTLRRILTNLDSTPKTSPKKEYGPETPEDEVVVTPN